MRSRRVLKCNFYCVVMTVRTLARDVKRIFNLAISLVGVALGYTTYSRPSRCWIGLREYCKRGNRHDLIKVHPAGVKFPIYMRRGTSDIRNYAQIFDRKEYSFLPNNPLTILDLGGYIGLASIWLANQYPNSKIILVEPDPDNYAIALLNCRGYENIKCLNYGVWSKSCRIALAAQVGGMDWGKMFAEVSLDDDIEDLCGIEAKSVMDLMTLNGIDRIDFLKIDIEGAEKILFDSPDAMDWIQKCEVISCELHDRFMSGCSDSVYKAVSRAGFSSGKHGEFDYFIRERS